MRVFRSIGFVWLGLLVTAAPALAATYSWPIAMSQPVSVSNLTYSTTSELIVVCSITSAGSSLPLAEGTTTVPVTVANGLASYTGNILVQLTSQSNPPLAGAAASCLLREKTAGTFTNIGSASSLKLP
jgi:hypothetical protein